MKLEYIKIDILPPLAWLADVKNGSVTVVHGNKVEVNEAFWVEGAWNGDFFKGDFSSSDWFCGTGAKLEGEAIVFSTPSHSCSGLFTASAKDVWGGGVLVSNSLHFLCAYAKYNLDAQYLNYEVDFNTILFGINDYKECVYARSEDGKAVDVKVHYYRDIRVSSQGEVEIYQKKKCKPFLSYQDYYARLNAAIEGMVNNAQDTSRKLTYGIVTTISKGYDSPCCAAIAHKYGCDTAVTFNAVGKYAKDSGIEVAQALGYKNIIERNPDEYMNRTDLAEAEQISSGELGSALYFINFDNDFADNLVFTGDRGGYIWAKEYPSCNDEFRFNDTVSHLGQSERRLWIGYIFVPMPLYGASSWTSIQRISQSDEMKKWSLGNAYDRPIPRRILEDAGIRRDLFGISKHGAGINLRYDWEWRAKTRISPTAAKSFAQYVKVNKRNHIFQLIKYFWNARNIYLSRIGIKISSKKTALDSSQIANATSVRYLFPWAHEIIKQRYIKIIQKRGII